MDWGAILAALVAPAAAIVSSVAGLRLANKLGIGPVQSQYVEILSKLNEAKQDRIEELEAKVASLEARVDELERERLEDREKIDDLEQTEFRLRQQLARRKRGNAT